MIAKVSRRVAGGSFERLAAYVSDDQKIGDLRDWRRTADYILDQKGGGERVAAIRVTNCANEEPGLALAEIALTQKLNNTSKGEKTYHLIVSFPPGEMPTPQQLHDIEDTLCAAIGLADHQRISAVHNDKDHFHFHVAINKVHPTTLRNVTPYFDQPRLQAACIDLEKKHSLTLTNHQMPNHAGARIKVRAEAMELHGKQQSLIHWVRDEAGPALLAAQEAGKGWQDLHRAAAEYGLEIKPRGAGLVIVVSGDKYARVKPSDIDRRLTFGALTEKWGTYQAPSGPKPAPSQVYPRAPIQTASPRTAELYKTYQRDRERLTNERKANREENMATSKAYIRALGGWAVSQRKALRALDLPPHLRRESYDNLNRTRANAMQAEKTRLAEVRKAGSGQTIPSWPQWLQGQAEQGNAEALDVLRATERRQAELGAAVLSAGSAEQAKHIIYQHLRPSVGRDGAAIYTVADGGRVTDRAAFITVDKETTAATALGLSLAAERFGDRPLVVNGSDEFKRQVAEVAALEGFNVTFADQDIEAVRQRYAAERWQASQAPPPVQPAPTIKGEEEALAFIAARNATADRVADVKHHRLWTSDDAGEATYQGRRGLGDDIDVILLGKDNETLVKLVSNAQAARAAGWTIGDEVELDARGRTIDHQAAASPDEQIESVEKVRISKPIY